MSIVTRSEISQGALPGHASYFLQVVGEERIKDISIVSFKLTEKAGEPYRIDIVATHPIKFKRDVILGHQARFTMALPGATPRVWGGRITHFTHTKTTKDINNFEIVIEAHIGCLNPHTTRTYQHKTARQIISEILVNNGLRDHQFEFKLRREYPVHAFRFQYRTGDWRFIQILMQQEGIFSYVVQGEHGDVVVFGDDIDHYIYQPALSVPYRENSGLVTGEHSVSVLHTHTTMVPQSFVVADYNPDLAWELLKAKANVATGDTTTFGQPYVFGTNHLSYRGAEWEAELRHEAALAWQVVYEGISDIPALSVGRILTVDVNLPDAPHGQVVIEVIHSGGRSQSYSNSYKAIPSNRRFRLKIEDDTWPKISGSLSARVTSPNKYKYPYVTKLGYYVVRLDCDLGEWPKGGESVPLRLAKPFAGAVNTGFHFPVVDGTEAVIEFRDGDPNKPYIAAFHHNSQQIDLITNQDRWMSRHVIHTQGDNRIQFEDWEKEEHVKLSTQHSGKSQLTLGHIVNGQRQKRGEGFELRTAAYGSIRAGYGLHLTAHNRPDASGKQLDMQETIAQLEKALALARSLADSARASKTQPADTDGQKNTNDQLDQFKEPAILASAPGPVGIVSGKSVQVTANNDIQAIAGKNVDLSIGKSFTVAAAKLVSLFAQKLGINIFAAKGPIKIQAQSDTLQLAAAQDVTVSSVDGAVFVRAANELTLECGGAFIQMRYGEITLGAVHGIVVRGPFQKLAAAQMHLAAPAFSPKMTPFAVGCRSWDGSAGEVARKTSPAPAPDALDWKSLGNPATVEGGFPAGPEALTLQSFTRDTVATQTNTTQQPQNDTQKLVNADHEPTLTKTDSSAIPIKLQDPEYCDWFMPGFTSERSDVTETASYNALDRYKRPWLSSSGHQIVGGSTFPTVFELAYDEGNKTLHASIRVKIIPVDLFKSDGRGVPLLGPDGKKQSVPFDHDAHWEGVGRGVGKLINGGFVMEFRESTGPRFELPTKKRQVEAVLNAHGSKFILDGCSKGTSCGCRVSIKFHVDFLLGLNDADVADGKKVHKTIYLFPRAIRADARSWGEVNLLPQRDSYVDNPDDTNVVAHECGHMFNFPDEYWEFGGWVHKMYIENSELNFATGDMYKGKETWQMRSENNFMGYGANKIIKPGTNGGPTAMVSPHYLEYIRRHFSELTHKAWRIGYGG